MTANKPAPSWPPTKCTLGGGILMLLLMLVVVDAIIWLSTDAELSPDALDARTTRFTYSSLRSAIWAGATCSPQTVALRQTAVGEQALQPGELSSQELAKLQERVTFKGAHYQLCDHERGQAMKWEYCLPISGRMDEPYCSHAAQRDLLVAHDDPVQGICVASVLHMLLLDVYRELGAVDAEPALLYGSLLGAVRNQTLIPYTEDVDLGYMRMDNSTLQDLQARLWRRGYHLFKHYIWRVCVAPTHPLARNLFDASKVLTDKSEYEVPYVDLYEMERLNTSEFYVEVAKSPNHTIPIEQALPYSTVELNGKLFGTLADPIGHLITEYGPESRDEFELEKLLEEKEVRNMPTPFPDIEMPTMEVPGHDESDTVDEIDQESAG